MANEGSTKATYEELERKLQWLRALDKLIVVWGAPGGEGRSRIYEVNTCYPGGAGIDGSLVCHVKAPEQDAVALAARPETGKLEHSRSCSASGGRDESCTCALQERIYLRTEQEMHAAWRKRAEEAELELARVRGLLQRLSKAWEIDPQGETFIGLLQELDEFAGVADE